MDGGTGGWMEGQVGGGSGGWRVGWVEGRGEAEGRLTLPLGPFGVAMSPRSTGHRPRQDWRALRDISP